jgi:hypothetical protein
MHNKNLYDLYSFSSIIRMMKSRRMQWAGHVMQMGGKTNMYKLLVGKPERKRPLGGPRCKWMNNIKMYPVEIGWVMWTELVWLGGKWRALVMQ